MHLTLTASGSLQTLQTLRRYTGQVRDATLMLTCHNARYYDLGAGQFVSADSVLSGGGYDILGLSRYAYVEGNPETKNDPSGHCWPLCAIVAAIAVGVVAAAVDVTVQAVQNGGNLSKVNYGQAVAIGVGAAVVTGAVLLTGGAALAAEGGAAAAEDASAAFGNALGKAASRVVARAVWQAVGKSFAGGAAAAPRDR